MDYDVLVVSNHYAIRDSTTRVLEAVGEIPPSKVCQAASAIEAIRTIDGVVNSGGRIGVVITDMRLDGVNGKGLELVEYVKNLHPSTKVIVTSFVNPKADAEKALGRGAFAYFPKDGNIEVLAGLVHSALNAPNRG